MRYLYILVQIGCGGVLLILQGAMLTFKVFSYMLFEINLAVVGCFRLVLNFILERIAAYFFFRKLRRIGLYKAFGGIDASDEGSVLLSYIAAQRAAKGDLSLNEYLNGTDSFGAKPKLHQLTLNGLSQKQPRGLNSTKLSTGLVQSNLKAKIVIWVTVIAASVMAVLSTPISPFWPDGLKKRNSYNAATSGASTVNRSKSGPESESAFLALTTASLTTASGIASNSKGLQGAAQSALAQTSMQPAIAFAVAANALLFVAGTAPAKEKRTPLGSQLSVSTGSEGINSTVSIAAASLLKPTALASMGDGFIGYVSNFEPASSLGSIQSVQPHTYFSSMSRPVPKLKEESDGVLTLAVQTDAAHYIKLSLDGTLFSGSAAVNENIVQAVQPENERKVEVASGQHIESSRPARISRAFVASTSFNCRYLRVSPTIKPAAGIVGNSKCLSDFATAPRGDRSFNDLDSSINAHCDFGSQVRCSEKERAAIKSHAQGIFEASSEMNKLATGERVKVYADPIKNTQSTSTVTEITSIGLHGKPRLPISSTFAASGKF
jgi:hypothetical protein